MMRCDYFAQRSLGIHFNMQWLERQSLHPENNKADPCEVGLVILKVCMLHFFFLVVATGFLAGGFFSADGTLLPKGVPSSMMSMKGLSFLLFMVACAWKAVPGAGGALRGSNIEISISAVFAAMPSSVTASMIFCAVSSGSASSLAGLAPALAAEGF